MLVLFNTAQFHVIQVLINNVQFSDIVLFQFCASSTKFKNQFNFNGFQ